MQSDYSCAKNHKEKLKLYKLSLHSQRKTTLNKTNTFYKVYSRFAGLSSKSLSSPVSTKRFLIQPYFRQH